MQPVELQVRQLVGQSADNQTFSLSLTMGFILDGDYTYQDVKLAIPNLQYTLTSNFPNFLGNTPTDYDPEVINETITVKVGK